MKNSGAMWPVMFRSLVSVAVGQQQELVQEVMASLLPNPSVESVPTTSVVEVFQHLATVLKDPHLGLHAGEQAPHGAFEVFDYSARVSSSLEDVLRRICRYYKLINTAGTLELVVAGRRASLIHHSDADRSRRHQAVEFLFSSIIGRCRLLVSRLSLTHVYFAHKEPADTAEHQRIFKTDVTFEHETDILEFPSECLSCLINSSQPQLVMTLDRYVEDLFVTLKPDYLSQVHQAIFVSIRGRSPSLSATAKQMRTSIRTLQRKLAELNKSHSQLVDEAREQLCSRYINQVSLSIGEISYLLGYDGLASFYRAFKRWYGTTPAEYRKKLLS